MSTRDHQTTEAGPTLRATKKGDEPFDSEYFEAGVLRRSRSLTQTAYEGIVFSWVRRRRPELLSGRGHRALEIGCGYGYSTELLANLGYKVTGVDISPHAIAQARREVSREDVEFLVWDATGEPVFDEGFDLILAFEVVEHLADPETALTAWRELLIPGGTLILTTPNKLGLASRYWRDPTHLNVRGHLGWNRALRDSGPWNRVSIDAVQWIPYTWRRTHVMRSLPLPILGATLRISATRP